MGITMKTPFDSLIKEFVKEVGSTGPVAIEGGKPRWNLHGLPIAEPNIIRAPSGIITHTPEEMIVKVRAGTTVMELHKDLKKNGQRTSLPERGGTVGGAIAVGENNLNMLGRGRVRDAVLQIRYISAEGEIITCGAPVVKNVSGFSLHKLMVGSLGTLGVIAEVTLRTNPIPDMSTWVTASSKTPQDIFNALYKPSAVLWDGETIWVHLEGHVSDIENQRKTLLNLGNFEAVEDAPGLPRYRWSMKPSDLVQINRQETGNFVASIGVGTLWADRPQPRKPVDQVSEKITKELKHQFDPHGRLNPGRTFL